MSVHRNPITQYTARLRNARQAAEAVDKSESFDAFVEVVRRETPWRFNGAKELDRYLHNVDHHLSNFAPRVLACIDGDVHTIFDFGCGSGSGSIALAMMFPGLRCQGVDVSPSELAIGRERAKLYGVSDRCRFECIKPGQSLPVPDDEFDLCICCSVLEYVTDPAVREFCVREMARVIKPKGLLFMTVPNRLYPVELHSRKFGWNYFPRLLGARIVGGTAWGVKNLARPYAMSLYRTPVLQMLTPWTNFCLRKGA